MNTRFIAFVLLAMSVGLPGLGWGKDYSGFAQLPVEEKDRIVWQLHDQGEWGLPEQKPICKDLLMHQGYESANSIAWTTYAIDLAEQQGWDDFKPLIAAIYERPKDFWRLQRAFLYLRKLAIQPIAAKIVEDSELVQKAGLHKSSISDAELASAQARLVEAKDRDAVLIYMLPVACWNSGKGGTLRGRNAAIEVMKGLDAQVVASRIRQLHADSQGNAHEEIAWAAKRLEIKLNSTGAKPEAAPAK